jgi:hypothetical protein
VAGGVGAATQPGSSEFQNQLTAVRARADDIAVEIEATSHAEFSDAICWTVSDNARTLKFDTHEFESE